MLVNLTDVFTSEGRTVSKEAELELDKVTCHGQEFPVTEKEPVRLTLVNDGPGHALVQAETKLKVRMRCDRCLKEVEKELDLHISQKAVSLDKASEEELEEQNDFMEGYELNIDSLICNEIMTCWPMKILCRPDCKGLCPVCGKDLNTGACGCDTFVPDPRMAAIMDVFNANKEV